jgi:methionine synthase II (cobalamin-independent)
VGFPWLPGSATGIGSWPGTDLVEALKIVLGEMPELPYLPELPDRGPGADMIGRAAGLLVDMPVELYAGKWRTAARAGRDARRTADLWQRDLDALTDAASDHGAPLKVAVAGPWTLAAAIERPIGGRLLRDAGAVRDLVASLAEGVAVHVREVSARVPAASVILQLDEPSLPAVLAGEIRSESGYSTLRAVEETAARDALAAVIGAAAVPVVVHCCAPRAPVALLRDAGARGVSVDLDVFGRRPAELDALGEVLEAGLGLFAGAVPVTGAADGSVAAGRVRELWHTIGFSINELPTQVVVTPACGLAGATEAEAGRITAVCRDAARRLADA